MNTLSPSYSQPIKIPKFTKTQSIWVPSMASFTITPSLSLTSASSSSSVLLACSSSYCSTSSSVARLPENGGKMLNYRRDGGKLRYGVCRAMVQETLQGASANYAKEMERLSAKESLLLAFKDSGGFKSLVTGKTTDVQRIDVNERITGLERLNPTPRPTTSPYFEGRWNYEWLGTGSPILSASKFIFEMFPSTVASFLSMDVVIKDGYANATANLKFLNSIESKFLLSTKLSVEGPLRVKEESVEVVLEAPTVREEAVPEQLKGPFSQAVVTLEQLPVPFRDVAANGIKIPLTGAFQRLYMISYLDEEILILRDTTGIPEVLTRLDTPQTGVDPIPEYES